MYTVPCVIRVHLGLSLMLFESVAMIMISKSVHARVSGSGGVGSGRGRSCARQYSFYQVHYVDQVLDRFVCAVASAVSFSFDLELEHTVGAVFVPDDLLHDVVVVDAAGQLRVHFVRR